MIQNLTFANIGFLLKAKAYVIGEKLLYEIKAKRVYLVVIAKDMGETSKKKIKEKCQFYEVPYYEIVSKEELKVLFKKDIVSFGITNANIAKKLRMTIEKGG